jgi:hypothetical protein
VVGAAEALEVRRASAADAEVPPDQRRARRALALGEQIAAARPGLFAEPKVRFALAAAQRRAGFAPQAERFYATRSRSPARDAWRRCAAAEQWLAAPRGHQPPKTLMRCRSAAARPRLDGHLDEPVWDQAEPAPLRSPLGDDAEWPAVAMLAYDEAFLYVAVRCRQAPGATYATAEGPRPRDPDLRNHDRVEILLDVDRDFATFYRLRIDHRGWVAEDCWGDTTWNPTWFVASTSDPRTWTAEAAVPLAELVGEPPSGRCVWALGLQRVVPGVGFQSWTTPAAIMPRPEGFGYLRFEP